MKLGRCGHLRCHLAFVSVFKMYEILDACTLRQIIAHSFAFAASEIECCLMLKTT